MTNQYGRPIAGRLNGIDAEPGTILGPRAVTREWLVVIDRDERGVILGYAQEGELAAAVLVANPRSVVEANWRAAVAQGGAQ